MKRTAFLCLLLITSTRVGFAQFGGNAGGFGGSAAAHGGTAPVYGDNNNISPAEIERYKRQPAFAEQRDNGTSTFVEASILLNVKADEYVAVFGVTTEGKTPEVAGTQMDATIANFTRSLKLLGVEDRDLFVDFVTQNRIYEYRIEGTTAREELAGFELKKNVSIRFTDKLLLDKLVAAAARAQIFDLIKVDYVVKDMAAIQARLQAQTIGLIQTKVTRYQTLLGASLSLPVQVVVDKPGVYFPVEQYDAYTAAESESISVPYDRSRYTVQNARKSRTTYFNPLSGTNFDLVINPVIIEPVVQFTTYIKVKCVDKGLKK